MNKKLLLVTILLSIFPLTTLFADSTPTSSRVYGKPFTTKAFNPSGALAGYGAIDNSFGGNGSLDISSLLTNGVAHVIATLSDGSFFVGLDNGVDTITIAKYRSSGLLDTEFASPDGYVTLTPITGLQAMSIDSYDRIVIGGGDVNGAWMRRIDVDGSWIDGYAFPSSGTTQITALAHQSTQKLLAVGTDGTNGQIIRFLPTGFPDTAFGFNGAMTLQAPVTTNSLYNIIVDASNNFYIFYLDGTQAKVAKFDQEGFLVDGFGSQGICSVGLFDGASQETMRIAFHQNGELILAASNQTTTLEVKAINATSGNNSVTFTDFILSGSDLITLKDLITTTDGSLFVLYDNQTNPEVSVFALTSTGALDVSFSSGGTLTESPVDSTQIIMYKGAIDSQGQLYFIVLSDEGYNSVPYIYRVHTRLVPSTNEFLEQVAQQQNSVEQGTLDETFGDNRTYPGVVFTYCGNYGASLQQKIKSIIELSSGKFLVALDGLTDETTESRIILSRLNNDGTLDTDYADNGFVVLPDHGYEDLYATGLLEQNASNSVVVTGYSNYGDSVVYLVDADGDELNFDYDSDAQKALGVLVQGTRRILVFHDVDGVYGKITAYTPVLDLDTTFGDEGFITTASFAEYGSSPLEYMGALYGHAIDSQGNIIIAFENVYTSYIDVVKIAPDGNSLISDFGVGGIVENVFNNGIASTIYNIRVALDNAGCLNIATVLDNTLNKMSVMQLFAADGSVNNNFGTVHVELDGNAVLNHLGVLNDNTILMTGYVDVDPEMYMVIARVITDSQSSLGVLDTDFNPQGDTPGIAYFQVGHIRSEYFARNALGLAVSSETGDVVIAGYEQATGSTSNPLVMKIFGKPDTYLKKQYPALRNNTLAGTVDISFGLGNDAQDDDGSKDLTSLLGAGVAKVVYAYPAGSPYQGYLLIGVENGSEIRIARVQEAGTLLDESFGVDGISTISRSGSLNSLMVNLESAIVLAVSNGSNESDIFFLDEHGVYEDSFQALEFEITNLFDVKQQKSGRYICSGRDNLGMAYIFAIRDGEYNIDQTFNPLQEGFFSFAAGSFVSLAIYEDDTIFAAYSDSDDSNYVKMLKLRANGTLETDFGSSGLVNIGSISTDVNSVRVACDDLGRVVLATVSNSSQEISLAPYDVITGVRDATFASNTVLILNQLGADLVLSSMMINTDNKIMLFGYNQSGANGRLFAACVDEDGSLESTWAVHEIDGDPEFGVNTFTIGDATELHGSAIYFNGMIYLVGANTGSYQDVPLLMRMFGYDYVVALEQQPFESAAGFVDSTIDILTPGSNALNLKNYLEFAFLENATVEKLYIYPDGSMLLGFQKETSVYIIKMLQDFTVDSDFNNESGYIEISSRTNLVDIVVNNGENGDGSIYVLTKWWDVPVVSKYHENGDSYSNFSFYNSYNLVDVSAIKFSSNQRILLAGENDEGDYLICAYDIYGHEDLSYGNGTGYHVVSSEIQDLFIATLDDQFISYISGTDVRIDRVYPNGSGLMNNLWTNGYVTQSCTNPINSKLAYEDGQSIVLVVQDGDTAGNSLKVFRYSLQDGSSKGSETSITYPGVVLILVTMFLDNDNNIYVVGYDQTNHKVITARITSTSSTTIELDSLYAAGTASPEIEGVAHFAAGNLQVVTSGAYHPDRRVYFVGNSGDNISFIGRIFGDIYTEQILSVQDIAIPGDLDYTFDSFQNFIDGFINLRSLSVPFYNILENGAARAIAYNSDGSALIACSVGANLIVAKVNGDFQPDTDFGTAGLTTPYIMQVVHDIKVNDNGEFFVSGIHNGAQSVAHFYASGTLNNLLPTDISSSVATRTLRQKSGRYIVSGKKDNSGVISAYQSVSPFYLDSTFGPAALDGYYATGIDAQIDDFVIDNYDRICLVYRNPADDHVYVEKIMASGAGKDADFASGLAVDTGIVATAPALIGIDQNNNILIGATTSGGVSYIMLNGVDGTTTINTLTPGLQEISYPFLLTDIAVSYNEYSGIGSYYYLSGFNLDSDEVFLFRVPGFGNELGQIDTTFGYSGLVGYSGDNLNMIAGASIKPDGKFVVVGTANGTDPVAICAYLDPYILSYEQGQVIADPGYPDRTLNPTSGDLNLNELLSSLNLVTNDYDPTNDYVACKIYTYDDNDKMLILFTAENSILLARLRKDFTLDPLFNASGTQGYVQVNGLSQLDPMHVILHVDDLENIFVAGGVAETFVLGFDQDGQELSAWSTPTDNLSAGAYGLVRQSSYALILAGQNTYGSLLSYTTDGELDPEFGNGTPGIFSTTISAPIEAIALEQNSDAIFIAMNDGGSLILEKVLAHGSEVDSSFVVQDPIEDLNGNGIKIVTTSTDCVVVAAVTEDGLVIASYNIADGSTFAEQVLYDDVYADDFYLTDMYTTNNGQVVVVGYDTDNEEMFVARLTNLYIKDESFGYNGQFLDDIGSVEIVYGARIYNDNRILCVGKNDDDVPYMVRLFGDTYQNVYEQTGILGVPGTVDTTYHADSNIPGYLNLSELQAQSENTVAFGIQANAIVQDNEGRYLVTGRTNDGKLFLARYLSDGSLDNSFAGLENDLIYGGEGFGIAIDSQGAIFVAGYLSGEGNVAGILKFTQTGEIDTTFTNGFGSEGFVWNFIAERFNDIKIDSNGKLVVVGTAYDNSGLVLARYLASGSLDTSTFNSSGPSYGYVMDTNATQGKALALDGSDNIFVVGTTSGNSGYVAKYLSTGLLDTTGFNASGTVGYNSDPGTIVESGASELHDIILDNYGKVLVVGSGNSYGFIARYSSAGAVDTTFNTVGSLYNTTSSTLFAVAVGQDVDNYEDYIFVSGSTEMNSEGFVTRYTNAGVLDEHFIAQGSYACYDLVLNASDNPVVTGTTSDELNVFTALYADNGDLTTLFGTEDFILFDESTVVAVIAEDDGVHYLAFNDVDNETSFVVRLNNADEFDTTYSVNGISEATRRGARFMMLDGQNKIVLAGNDDNPWITRYQTNGSIDFEVVDEEMDSINVVREQTLTRLVGVGSNNNGYAAVRAYTDQGLLDSTFNSLHSTPGEYEFSEDYLEIHSLVIDEYDRLIIPVLNSATGDVDLYRLTSNGELDTSFGDADGDVFTGYVASALSDVYSDSSSVHVTLDVAGNIVVVAIGLDGYASNANGILVACFDNGTATIADGGNGSPVNGYDGGLIFTDLTDHTIADIVSVENGDILVSGYMTSGDDMWVASITSSGEEDLEFNPEEEQGICYFVASQDAQDVRQLQGMSIRYDGRISVVFYEAVTGISISYLGRIYNDPFEEGLQEAPNSEEIGIYNRGFGLDFNDSISFYATSDTDDNHEQVAQAVTLQGNNRILVALDGQNLNDTTSRVFVSQFTIDGLLDVGLNGTGQLQVPHEYENEYVRAVHAFMSPEGIHKILLAGYAQNTTLGVLTSWLMQYDLDNLTADSSFGGFDNDAQGTASGDLQELYTIALQSSGNIIASGLYFDDSGAVASYTSSGKLDKTFGSDGIYFHNDAQDGIFSHVVDSKNRVVFGYVDDSGAVVLARLLADGSGLDNSFDSNGLASGEISGISDSEHLRVGVNSDDELYIAVVQDDTIYVCHYGESGGLMSGSSTVIPDTESLSIARLIIDIDGNLTIFASDENETDGDYYIIIQLRYDLTINTGFNEQGYLKYRVNEASARRKLRDGVLHDDGRFVAVGFEGASEVI